VQSIAPRWSLVIPAAMLIVFGGGIGLGYATASPALGTTIVVDSELLWLVFGAVLVVRPARSRAGLVLAGVSLATCVGFLATGMVKYFAAGGLDFDAYNWIAFSERFALGVAVFALLGPRLRPQPLRGLGLVIAVAAVGLITFGAWPGGDGGAAMSGEVGRTLATLAIAIALTTI